MMKRYTKVENISQQPEQVMLMSNAESLTVVRTSGEIFHPRTHYFRSITKQE